MKRFILLAVVPIVILVCIFLFCKYTGFNMIPEDLRAKEFKFPKIKRGPGGEWVPDEDSESEEDEDSEGEENSESEVDDEDSDLEEFTKPLKNIKSRKKIRTKSRKKRYIKSKRPRSNLPVDPNDPVYRVLNGGLYD